MAEPTSVSASLISVEASSISSSAEPVLKSNRFDGLSDLMIWGYSVGHFINDLSAACWFNYLLYFLKKVVNTPAATSALLSGQICDGIATPIVGLLSDKISTRFGQRKPWYVGGLLLVLIGFIPIFSGFTSDDPQSMQAFYIIFPGVFNIGWAAVQISHMSLVPSLTCSRKRRDKLNNRRNLFTFISNFIVLGIGLIIFPIMPEGFLEYNIISYIVIFLGICSSAFFLWQIDEVVLTKISHEKAEDLRFQIEERKNQTLTKHISASEFSEDSDTDKIVISRRLQPKESIFDWFKMPKFYLFGICYMGVRLYTNIFGTLLPFYLTDVINLSADAEKISFSLALVPMLAYGSSVLISLRLNWFYERFGRKKALFLGTIICVVCLTIMLFLEKESNWVMYILTLFIGASQSLVLSTGINMISDVVGSKAKTGAFVFGIYSLLDKFSAGAVIFIIGNTEAYSKKTAEITQADSDFIRYTTVLIPGLSCVLAACIVLSYPIQEYKKKTEIEEELLNKQRKNSIDDEFVA